MKLQDLTPDVVARSSNDTLDALTDAELEQVIGAGCVWVVTGSDGSSATHFHGSYPAHRN